MHYLIKYKDGHKIFSSEDYAFLENISRRNDRTLDEEIASFLMSHNLQFIQSDNVADLIEEGDFLELGEQRWLFKVLKDSKGLFFYYDRFLKHYVSNKLVYQNIKTIYKTNSENELCPVWKKGE